MRGASKLALGGMIGASRWRFRSKKTETASPTSSGTKAAADTIGRGSDVRRPTDPDKDWAGVGRYLNVLRVEEPYRGPADNSTDFPIPSDLDEPQLPRLPAAFWSSADAHAA